MSDDFLCINKDHKDVKYFIFFVFFHRFCGGVSWLLSDKTVFHFICVTLFVAVQLAEWGCLETKRLTFVTKDF